MLEGAFGLGPYIVAFVLAMFPSPVGLRLAPLSSSGHRRYWQD